MILRPHVQPIDARPSQCRRCGHWTAYDAGAARPVCISSVCDPGRRKEQQLRNYLHKLEDIASRLPKAA